MFRKSLAKPAWVLAFAGFALTLTGLGACGFLGPDDRGPQAVYPADADAVTVVTGENFYGDLVHQLAGPRARVYSFLSDPAADPHLYESNPSGARAVADASIVVENGLGYDGFVDRLLGASPRKNRVVINVQKLAGVSDGDNPHLWYDPSLIPKIAQAITDALVEADPANATAFKAGNDRLRASLAPIDTAVAGLAARYAGARVAATEPVYARMLDAIGLRTVSPDGFMKAVEDGTEPPSADVALMQDLIRGRQVRVLLYNSQTITRTTAAMRDLATSSGVPVVPISETEPPGVLFQDWQLGQLRALQAALGG